MFQIDREHLDYEVALSSFKEQIADKNMLIEQFIYNLTTISNASFKSDKAIIEIVKFSRKFIEQINKIMQEMHGYLCELKLEFVHELFYKMFKIMIMAYNKLSQKFVMHIKELKKNNSNVGENYENQGQSLHISKKNQHKQLQYFDFVIKNLEEEELKIEERKKVMERQLLSEQASIATVTASDAVNQLQTLDKNIQRIISNSEKVSNENILYRYQELSKFILSLKKPQEIKEQFCNQLSGNMREKFIYTMERIMREFENTIRFKQRQLVLSEIEKKKPKLQSRTVQTQADYKTKQIESLIKERRVLLSDLEGHKKEITILEKEIERLKDKINEDREVNRTLEKKIENFDDSMKKKVAEIQKMKTQYEINLVKKNQAIESLNKKNQQLQATISNNNAGQSDENRNSQTKFDLFEQSLSLSTTSKRRTFMWEKQRSSINVQIQNQLKNKRKQNAQLKKNLQSLMAKLGELSYIQNVDLANVSKNGFYTQRVNEIITQLSISKQNQKKSVKIVQEMKQPQKEQPEKVEKKGKYRLNPGIKTIKFYTEEDRVRDHTAYTTINMSKMNKLEALKRQFIQKLSRKKKHIDSRVKKYISNQTNDCSHETRVNFSIDADMSSETKENKKQKVMFSRKDISFEQFSINKIPEKVSPPRMRKKYNTIQSQQIRQSRTKQKKRSTAKPIIAIQSYQIIKETKDILQQIEAKNDKQDYFMKHFIKVMLKQIREKKGNNFVSEIIKAQMGQDKTPKPYLVDQPEQIGQFVVKNLR